jgi:two-component system, chemotaxis family, chemotaxis protein CheY
MNKKIHRAVIVEDSPEMRALIHMVLGSLGAKEIVEAQDGVEALKALQASPTDVVIMDWNMEEMDGLECTRRIRGGVDGISPQIPIILLTGNTGTDAEAEAIKAGVDLYMAKPFSMKKLQAGLSKVFSRG